MNWTRVLVTAALVGAPSASWAQSRADLLAAEWREAKRAELVAERARLDAQIAALATATPDTFAVQADTRADSALRPVVPPVGPSPPAADTSPAHERPVGDVAGAKETSETDTGKPAAGEKPGGRRPFAGLDLGIGLSFTIDTGDIDRISEASIVDGIVRADDKDNGRARIMLESHYFFTPCWRLFLKNPCRYDRNGLYRATVGEERWGFGPFVAIQPGSGEIIDAIGMGIMVGARRAGLPGSFNIGVGIVIDPNTRVLGEGFRENQPPPGTEQQVRYRETLQKGVLLLTSFSF